MKHELPTLPVKEQARFRKLVDRLYWRKGMMPYYWDCPHEYVIDKDELYVPDAPWGCKERDFQYLSSLIEAYGKRMPWRSRRDTAMFDGRLVYWRIGCVINRTYRESMIFKGYPPPHVLEQMRKRFWPTRADRTEYAKYRE
jgi:hypothetical protein